jgi:predicted transposase/invertase (TIGR01784 family)
MNDMRSNLERTLDEIQQKAIEQGLEQGILRGVEQGIEQGRLMTARNLIAEGMKTPFIAKVTGLSEQAVDSLREQRH